MQVSHEILQTYMSKHPLDLTETTVSSQNVYDGELLHVYADRARLPDGKVAVREYVKHPGAVVIIPLLDNGELRQQPGFGRFLARPRVPSPATT